MAGSNGQDQEELLFLPLGGIGEIGMNLYLYGLGSERRRQWLMVDLGVTFPNDREPGVDVVLPDIRFIEEERRNLAGILLTHAHEDHFGAVAELWPRLRAPIYATRFTMALLKAKLADYRGGGEIVLHEVQQSSRFHIGPFDVELITMAHSIPETNGVAIRAAGGLVLHTADFKIDPRPGLGQPTDEARLRALGDEGVQVLVCDSTNALTEGFSGSEADVAKSLAQIIAAAKGRVIVTTFASHVARLLAVAEGAKAAGRELVLLGRSMHRVAEVARETGLWPPHLDYRGEEAYRSLRPEQVAVLCTGSQGEPRAALARIAEGEHPMAAFSRGDTVIFSSRTIPGNEQAVLRVQNNLADQGVELITNGRAGRVHVSGHPRRGELAKMYEWTRPRCLIPMHGEARHLEEHGGFARTLGIKALALVRNGAIVRLLPEPAEIVDEAPVGRLYRDGKLIIPAGNGVVRERRKLSFAGCVAVSVVINRNGEIAADPQAVMHGLPAEDQNGALISEIVDNAIWGALESIPRSRRKDPIVAGEAVKRSVRAALHNAWGKKPICSVLVSLI